MLHFPRIVLHVTMSQIYKPLFQCVTHNKGSVVKIDLLESHSRMASGTALMCDAGLFKYGWQLNVMLGETHRRPHRNIRVRLGRVETWSKRCEFVILQAAVGYQWVTTSCRVCGN